MALIKCPESSCSNMVSDQAATCPACGSPVRRVEYKFHLVTHSYEYAHLGFHGQAELDALVKDGWQIVDKQEEEQFNMHGEPYGYHWRYKLQR